MLSFIVFCIGVFLNKLFGTDGLLRCQTREDGEGDIDEKCAEFHKGNRLLKGNSIILIYTKSISLEVKLLVIREYLFRYTLRTESVANRFVLLSLFGTGKTDSPKDIAARIEKAAVSKSLLDPVRVFVPALLGVDARQ
jgi:hypothetical protein